MHTGPAELRLNLHPSAQDRTTLGHGHPMDSKFLIWKMVLVASALQGGNEVKTLRIRAGSGRSVLVDEDNLQNPGHFLSECLASTSQQLRGN